MSVKSIRFLSVAMSAALVVQPISTPAISLLGGGAADHYAFAEFYSSLPYDDAKRCALGLHHTNHPYLKERQQPSKVKLKKTKTSEIEQLEYGKYGFEMLEFEKGNPNSRAKLRYGSGFIKVDNKTKKAELAYEACMGPEGDPLAVSQFDAALAAFQPDRQLYESTFPPAQILTCMSAYPGKILRDYEASYYGAQITAYSRERIRIGWARSRSMQLNHQKFAFSHFILTRGGRTIVGVDAGTKEGFVGALKTTIGEKSWMGTLAKSCAVHGDDREAIYWPRSDR